MAEPPMSEQQTAVLRDLTTITGEPMPENLTQREAWWRIRSMLAAMNPSREEVRKVECPECSAASGQNCTSERRGKRLSNHQSRVIKARDVLGTPYRGGP